MKEQVSRFKLRNFKNSTASYRGMRNLDPKIIRMLGNMSDNMGVRVNPSDESSEASEANPKRIILNEKEEFGKY